MKIWMVPGGSFLVETERTKVGYVNSCGGVGGFGLNDAERFDESGSYVELSLAGEKRREWGRWLSIGFDETLAVWNIHRVIGETLYGFYWHQTSHELPETTAEPILNGLAPHSDELPSTFRSRGGASLSVFLIGGSSHAGKSHRDSDSTGVKL